MAATSDAAAAQTKAKSGRQVSLVVGDACVFLVFATVGWASHGEQHPLWWVWLTSAAPYALFWFIIAPFWGVYRPVVTTRTKAMLARTALAWVCAWPLGFLLRWLFTHQSEPLTLAQNISFAVTTLIFTAIFLEAWRLLFGLIANRKR
jgi:hypothetical protein